MLSLYNYNNIEVKKMNINEKAAYLQGLLDGMKLDNSKPENKLLTQIVSIISDMAEVIEDIKDETENLGDVVEELDAVVDELQDQMYDDDFDLDEFDDITNQIECPKCECVIILSEEDDPSDIICGNCGEHINLDECDDLENLDE